MNIKTNLPTVLRHSKKRRNKDKNTSIEYIESMFKSNIARFEAIRARAYVDEQKQRYIHNCIKFQMPIDQELMKKFKSLNLEA